MVILEGTRLTIKTESIHPRAGVHVYADRKFLMPSLTLDISGTNTLAAEKPVADWIEQAGRLYLPD